MQVSILSGTYTDGKLGVRTSYPVNLQPVFVPQGVSSGYLRPADGIVQNGTGPDICRGGITWNGVLYRVHGDKLCSVSSAGVVTEIGSVGADSLPVAMDYSFDYLCVVSAGGAYLYDGTTLTKITDADLGTVYDVIFIDGYFMFTDNEFAIVNDLANPFSISPFKYGSSEVDPDDVQGLVKIRNYAYIVNRNTIEIFDNTGDPTVEFPFQRIESAQIPKGAIGRRAFTKFKESVAFVGSDRNEQPSVYIGNNSDVQRIATREIDDILSLFTETQLADVVVEDRNDRGSDLLYIHLPDRTLVFDATASQMAEQPIWFVLSSGIGSPAKYKARYFVYAYDKWTCADPTSAKIGYLTDSLSSHWGQNVTWEFGTSIVYNEGSGAIFSELELVTLTGRVDTNAQIASSYSTDGQNWSQDKYVSVGGIGNRSKRLVWRRQGFMRNWRVQRFRGDTSAYVSFLRLEAKLEPLAR